MHIEAVHNRGSHPTILLRQSYREGDRVRKRTLANLTALPPDAIEILRRALRGEKLVPCDQAFAIERSIPHGHVKAILGTIRKIGIDTIIASKRSPQRDLVVAMIAERLLHGRSKLASTRLWHTTTLAEELSVQDADVDEVYQAMDWLLERQERIEKKLAARHLGEGSHVLYDITSSYYEGHTCPLARRGHNRDGKKGKSIIVYGLLTNSEGRPVAVEVYPGNTGDPSTVGDQVDKLRNRFGISRVVLVGDRGMLTQAQIEKLRAYPQLGWISALRSESIHQLMVNKELQPSLFDTKNLAQVERGFRCLKGIDIRVRPIHHSTDPRVRAHVFLCFLAYYVEWHIREALGSLLFDDQELSADRWTRDPVAQAEPSDSARRKKVERSTADGFAVHSFDTLLEELGTLCRNRCRIQADPSGTTFTQDTQPTELQARIFELLGL